MIIRSAILALIRSSWVTLCHTRFVCYAVDPPPKRHQRAQRLEERLRQGGHKYTAALHLQTWKAITIAICQDGRMERYFFDELHEIAYFKKLYSNYLYRPDIQLNFLRFSLHTTSNMRGSYWRRRTSFTCAASNTTSTSA